MHNEYCECFSNLIGVLLIMMENFESKKPISEPEENKPKDVFLLGGKDLEMYQSKKDFHGRGKSL